jgi:hypothetical protein
VKAPNKTSFKAKAHLFFVAEAAFVCDRFDSIRGFFEPSAGSIDTNRLDRLRGSAAARLRIKPREVSRATR